MATPFWEGSKIAYDGDYDPDADQVLGFDRKGQRKQHHFLIGIENAEGHEQSEDATGSANRSHARVHAQEMCVGDGNGHQSGTHYAEQVALEKTARAPIALEVGSDKPEREHVEEQVTPTGMEQRVGDELPDLALHDEDRDQREPFVNPAKIDSKYDWTG